LELVRKRFDTESHDSLIQAIEEFNKLAITELVKLNMLSFCSEDLAEFSLSICSRLKSKNVDDVSEEKEENQLSFHFRGPLDAEMDTKKVCVDWN